MSRWWPWGWRGLAEFGFVLPVAGYPVLFVYFRNCAEASASQIWLPLAGSVAIAAACHGLFSWAGRRADVGAMTAQVAILLIALWRPLEEAVRDLHWPVRYWHLAPLALAGCVALARVLARRGRGGSADRLALRKWMCGLFWALIACNAAGAFPVLWRQAHPSRLSRPAAEASPAVPEDRPNVYFILLDEYAPFSMMSKYFNEGPSDFAAFLERNAFNVSTTSCNPSFLTTEVLAGLVGMAPPPEIARYTLTEDGCFGRYLAAPSGHEEIFAESALMRFFKGKGYEIYVASMLGDFFHVRSPFFADHVFDRSADPRGIRLDNTVLSAVLERSALEPLRHVFPGDAHGYNRMVEGIFDWISEPDGKQSPRFLWAHVACPHAPYLFERDGTWRQEPGSPSDRRHYLEQHRYVTRRVMEVLDALVKSDPGCVILLQSDHGYRCEITLPVEDMAHIFNAAYFRGERMEMEGLSGLDTECLAINRLFGTDFPVVRGRRPLAGVAP